MLARTTISPQVYRRWQRLYSTLDAVD